MQQNILLITFFDVFFFLKFKDPSLVPRYNKIQIFSFVFSRDRRLYEGAKQWKQRRASWQWRTILLHCATMSSGRSSFP